MIKSPQKTRQNMALVQCISEMDKYDINRESSNALTDTVKNLILTGADPVFLERGFICRGRGSLC